MIASQWVIEELLEASRQKRWKELKALSAKYGRRYPKDDELREIARETARRVKSGDGKKLAEITERLEVMFNARKLEGSGGSELRFPDTRKKNGQTLR